MKYWENKSRATKNLVVLSPSSIAVYSIEKENLEQIPELLGNSPAGQVPRNSCYEITFDSITRLNSLSTNLELDLTYKNGKEEDTETIDFENETARDEFLNSLQQNSEGRITPTVQQLSSLSAASMSIASLLVACVAIFSYLNKIPYVALSVGGLWAAASAIAAYHSYTNPPIKTYWNVTRAPIEQGVRYFQLARAWGFVLAFVFYGTTVIPDKNGPQIIYDHAQKEMLSLNNIDALMQRGGDIDYVGKDGQSVLHVLVDQAAWRADEIGSDLLLGALTTAATGLKQNIDKDDLRNEPEELALALIDRGANVNVANQDGTPILPYAIFYYADNALNFRLFESMLKQGAKVDDIVEDGMSVREYLQDYPIVTPGGKDLQVIIAAYD